MGKYVSYSSSSRPKEPIKREVHPVWRGIGFVMIILIPFMSFIGTLILLDENTKNGWFAIPVDLISPYIEPYLYVKIMLTVTLLFIFYSILLFVNALMNRLLAPPRYTIYDAPPQAFHGKKKSR
ncbi:MAG: hypothetical protein WCG34_00675 [Leptolinea sp.]